jgi:hypothetical protein
MIGRWDRAMGWRTVVTTKSGVKSSLDGEALLTALTAKSIPWIDRTEAAVKAVSNYEQRRPHMRFTEHVIYKTGIL